MKSMAESMQEVEVKKRQLEEHVSITWQNQGEVRIEHDGFLSPLSSSSPTWILFNFITGRYFERGNKSIKSVRRNTQGSKLQTRGRC